MKREISEHHKTEIARIEREFSAALESSMPHLEVMQRAMASMSEPIRAAVAAMQPSIAIFHEAFKTPEVIVSRYMPQHESRTVRLAPDQFEALIPQNTSTKFIYDSKNHELAHALLGHEIYSSFTDKKDNKRVQLFEKILRVPPYVYVPSESLMNMLKQNQKELGNTVAAINRKIGTDFKLKENLIVGEHGKGYRINPAYSIYTR